MPHKRAPGDVDEDFALQIFQVLARVEIFQVLRQRQVQLCARLEQALVVVLRQLVLQLHACHAIHTYFTLRAGYTFVASSDVVATPILVTLPKPK